VIEPRLQYQLMQLERLRRNARRWRALALCWAVMTGVGVSLWMVRAATSWNVSPLWWSILPAGVLGAFASWILESRRPADLAGLVNAIERDHPELQRLLSTALEQKPDAASGRYHYLQLRVVNQVLTHPQRSLWRRKLRRKLFVARSAHAVTLTGFVTIFLLGFAAVRHPASGSRRAGEIVVAPGDAQVERGTGLVITARFDGQPPSDATLVMVWASGRTSRIPLEHHLADPVFGTSLSEVMESSSYYVEYGAKKTRDYRITVFEYPALIRADAALRFPQFTGLTNKTIPDTLRVSAVEGTILAYTFQLNKPVVQARLVGSEETRSLAVHSNAVATLDDMVLTNGGRFALQLIDAGGRTNKSITDIFIQVLPDRRPDLKLAFPRGDQRVSSLQELQLQAGAVDDFGLLKYGFGFGVAGQEPNLVESGKNAAANDKRQFDQLIALEKLGVEVDQLISYFVWADDYGPDGQVRRTYSDMFFAEVRPFEEIFRPDQSGAAEGGNQNQRQGQGQGSQSTRLADLQKQIVIATWKLQREKGNAAGVRIP
jgi:hypothetical protein